MRNRLLAVHALLLLAAGIAGAQVVNRGALAPPRSGTHPPVVTGVRHPGAHRYYERAQEYAREHRWALATRDLRRALELDGNFLEAILLLALVYRESGDPARALEQYEWAIRHGAEEPEVRILIAEIHLARGDLLGAMKQYVVLRDLGSPRASDLWWRVERYVRERG